MNIQSNLSIDQLKAGLNIDLPALINQLTLVINNRFNRLNIDHQQALYHLQLIQQTCNQSYSAQGEYGHAALNRMILLDDSIAQQINRDTLILILRYKNQSESFDNNPTLIKRYYSQYIHAFSCTYTTIGEALYYGFENGYLPIQYLGNNNTFAQSQQERNTQYQNNTLKIVKTITDLADEMGIKPTINSIQPNTIPELIKQVRLSIDLNEKEQLINDYHNQVKAGFKTFLALANISYQSNESSLIFNVQITKDALISKLLGTLNNAVNHSLIQHYLFDKAHFKCCLSLGDSLSICCAQYTLSLSNIMTTILLTLTPSHLAYQNIKALLTACVSHHTPESRYEADEKEEEKSYISFDDNSDPVINDGLLSHHTHQKASALPSNQASHTTEAEQPNQTTQPTSPQLRVMSAKTNKLTHSPFSQSGPPDNKLIALNNTHHNTKAPEPNNQPKNANPFKITKTILFLLLSLGCMLIAILSYYGANRPTFIFYIALLCSLISLVYTVHLLFKHSRQTNSSSFINKPLITIRSSAFNQKKPAYNNTLTQEREQSKDTQRPPLYTELSNPN